MLKNNHQNPRKITKKINEILVIMAAGCCLPTIDAPPMAVALRPMPVPTPWAIPSYSPARTSTNVVNPYRERCGFIFWSCVILCAHVYERGVCVAHSLYMLI